MNHKYTGHIPMDIMVMTTTTGIQYTTHTLLEEHVESTLAQINAQAHVVHGAVYMPAVAIPFVH